MRRLNVGLIAMAFVLSLFAGRLVQLQGLESKVYVAKANKQRMLDIELPARRGMITDSHGKVLAMTVDAKEIFVDPTLIPAQQRSLIAGTLAAELRRPPEEILGKLGRTGTQYVRVARRVDPAIANKIMSYKLKGVGAKPEYRRVYPGGTLAGDLIGGVGSEGYGLGGVEYAWEKTLAGQNGRQSIELGREGQYIPMSRGVHKAPVSGRDVRLTIERDIQWMAQEAIAKEVESSRARSGTIIIMDIRTGQVLALANAPEVDNATPQEEQGSYGNRAVTEVFEPGSTNKVITAAAALEVGGVRPETPFTVPDKIKCADRVLRDAHPHKIQKLTFSGVLATSSNVGTIKAAQRVGSEQLHTFLRAFGFGAKTGLGFPAEAGGLLPEASAWSGSQRCTVAFGQGVSVTAMQMASVYQTVANGGVRITPQLVAGVTDEYGKFVPAPAPKQQRVISARTADEVGLMLEAAITTGTGGKAQIPGYRVAGKTGTAERYDEERGGYYGYTASFAGFTPADNPSLVGLVVLQDPKGRHYGGDIAAPVFKEVMTFALKSRKVPPTGARTPNVRIHAQQ